MPTRHVPAPVRVVGVDGQAALERVAAVGAGYEISWARIDDGTLRSWGWNVFGELAPACRWESIATGPR